MMGDWMLSKKLLAFLAALLAGLGGLYLLPPEQGTAFIDYVKWLTTAYIGGQSLVDGIHSLRKGTQS